jgi:hypothetical protein
MIELAIASLILSILVSGVLFTYRTAINSYRQTEIRLELYQNAYAALGTMAQDLRGAYLELKGSTRELSLQTTFQTDSSRGLRKERFYLDDKGLHRQEGKQDSLLAVWVDTLEFSYNDGKGWSNTWDKLPLADLPAAVRIRIKLKSPPGKFQQENTFESTVPVISGRKQLF